MRDLVLQVDPALGRRAGLEQALRQAIRDGRLSPGMILPSTRTLAADLGLARATVVAAFEQLTVEGYVVARQGVGTIVSDIPAVTASERDDPGSIPRLAVDFRPGEPDNSLFPRAAWLRSVRRVIADSPDHMFGYGHPAGHLKLRVALAAYLGRSRAVLAKPDDLSIFGGATAAVGYLAELFRTLGIRRIAVEDPSLFLLRDVWQLAGVTPVPVPVPVDDEGIDIAALERLGLDAVMVTPSHQYPLGVTMSADRRAAVAAWARKRRAWVIEDDYDGEFRYDRQAIGALQGLDPERVIYLGTPASRWPPDFEWRGWLFRRTFDRGWRRSSTSEAGCPVSIKSRWPTSSTEESSIATCAMYGRCTTAGRTSSPSDFGPKYRGSTYPPYRPGSTSLSRSPMSRSTKTSWYVRPPNARSA